MAEVIVHATRQILTADGPLLDYYRGEAVTVGGYTIDGAEYPRKIAFSDFDPADHTVDEVNEHLAQSMPGEQARVLDAERAGQARVTLLREYELPEVEQLPPGEFDESLNVEQTHPGFGEPSTGVEHPADGTWSPVVGNDPADDDDDDDDHPSPRPH